MLTISLTMESACNQQIADNFSRSQATIETWINQFGARGIDAFSCKCNSSGPKSRFTPRQQVSKVLATRIFPALIRLTAHGGGWK